MSSRLKLKDLVEELHDVKTKWRAIGVQLEMEPSKLRQIDYSYKADPEAAFMDMMEAWLVQLEPPPSWGAIVDALRSRSVGETALASDIENRRCPGRPASAPPSMRAPHPPSGVCVCVFVCVWYGKITHSYVPLQSHTM